MSQDIAEHILATRRAKQILAPLGAAAPATPAEGYKLQFQVATKLGAVPPAGIEGIVAADKAKMEGVQIVYGALGIGGTKMKIHRAAIMRLFESNDAVLDAEELLAIGEKL